MAHRVDDGQLGSGDHTRPPGFKVSLAMTHGTKLGGMTRDGLDGAGGGAGQQRV